MEILFIASGGLTVFFIILLLTKKGSTLSDRLLILWFSLILINIIGFYVLQKKIDSVQFLLELSNASPFLHGPVLWFYTLSLTKFPFRFRWIDLLHGIPFVVSFFILMIPLASGKALPETTELKLMVLKFISTFVYVLLTALQLRKHLTKIPEVFSYKEKVELNWLRFLTYGFLSIWLIGFISMLLHHVAAIPIEQFGGIYVNAALCMFVLILGIFGFKQTTIFVPAQFIKTDNPFHPSSEKKTILDISEPAKYQKSGLDKATARQYFEKLIELMQTKQLYLDKELTLYKLADLLRISPNNLSQAINTFAEKNFFDFINEYRVKEVQQKIQEGLHSSHTLLGIALDCGFNSKASFNRAFKKFTEMTPSQFKTKLEA